MGSWPACCSWPCPLHISPLNPTSFPPSSLRFPLPLPLPLPLQVILFIDEVHLVLGAGKTEGAMDAANLLKPMLARGELRLIGATTLTEYREHVERDAAFERRFQQVLVGEPSVPDTVQILRGLKERYASHHGVQVRRRGSQGTLRGIAPDPAGLDWAPDPA